MIITGKKFSKPELSRVINGDAKPPEATEKPAKTRLDRFLTEKHQSYNRSTIQRFIRQGYVTVDGETITKPNYLLLESQTAVLSVPEAEKVLPELPVIYEDENIKVINKPAGLLSMAKGEYCPEPTLEDYGLLVHRLDRATSGVVILAKDIKTQSFLRKQFQQRTCHKTYYAVVVGHPKYPEANIDLPITRNLNRPTTFMVSPSGKPAQTYYKVIKQSDNYALLELKPTTGRTHQLRVHLAYLGTPILGDEVYGEKSSRLFLHAYQLEITIPGGERRIFTAKLPKEFNDVF